MKYLWFALLLMLSGSIRASEYYWVGNTSAWATLGNWRIGSTSGTVPTVLPGSADNVFITAGSAPIIQLSAAANIGGLTIVSPYILDLNGTGTFGINGSLNLKSGQIINSVATVTNINVNNTDVTIGINAGGQVFRFGSSTTVDRINLNITTAKFTNYGSFDCNANFNLIYKVNPTTPSDNFIKILGASNYGGTFTLTINENTVATRYGEAATTDNFMKAARINKYSNVDFSFGTTSDGYKAVFNGLLTLNGESKVGTNVSNLILGDQCNATMTLNAGLELLFTKNTNIVLGKYVGAKQPKINITGSMFSPATLPVTYTAGNFEAYGVTLTSGMTIVNLGTIGKITTDKSSSFGGGGTLTCNSLSMNATTFFDVTTLTCSTPNIQIANTAVVNFMSNVTLASPSFTTATLLGGATAIRLGKDLTVTQSTPITTYSNANVNGFKYVEFYASNAIDQTYNSNSIVPFYRVEKILMALCH